MQAVQKVHNVLFLSRRNSARSLMAEAVLGRYGAGRFRAFSAGVAPSPKVDPVAMDVLRQGGYPTDGLRPKDWRELTGSGGPVFDFVFTMSDTAAGETLPEWRGQPETAHWRYADPIKAEGTELERRRPFVLILSGLERQLQIFVQLPFALLDHMALKARLDELGRSGS
jgi:arsenate reductase (thioredoxin)